MRRGLLAAAVAVALVAATPSTGAAEYQATKASLDTHRLPDWWRDAKFGIFIHWGPASVPAWTLPNGLAGFWYWLEQQVPGTPTWAHHLQTYGANVTYDDLIAKLTAAKYDPDAWVRTFKDAGARYFLLTTKHHDGFAMWCSRTSRRNACDMGPHRDLVGPLVDAARRQGMKAGLYYSIPEWFSPAPRPAAANVVSSALSLQSAPAGVLGDSVFNLRARNAYTQAPVPYTGYVPIDDYGAGQVRPQLRELIDTYHPDELWCDIGGAESYYHSNASIAHLYNAAATTNPQGVVVNDRCGDGNTHVDFASVEQGNGYTIGTQTIDKPTETDRAIGSWFYSDGNTDDALPTRAALLGELVTAVSMNSNYVLNISPRADGTLPEPLTSRLAYLGRWLKINGGAIYGSRPWTQGSDDNNANTRFTVGADGAFNIITIGWPGAQLKVQAPVPVPAGAQLRLLGSNAGPLPWRLEGTTLVIDLPSADMTQATRSEGAAVIRIAREPAAAAVASGALRVSGRPSSRSLRALAGRGLPVRAGCDRRCDLRVTLAADAGTAAALGQGRRTRVLARIARPGAAGPVTVRLRPARRLRHALARRGRVVLSLAITAHTSDGARAAVRRTVVLRKGTR